MALLYAACGALTLGTIVRAAAPLTQLPAALEEMKATLRPDGSLDIQYNPAEVSAMSILAQLSAEGLEIADIATEESDLEDVFLQLTSGAHNAAS